MFDEFGHGDGEGQIEDAEVCKAVKAVAGIFFEGEGEIGASVPFEDRCCVDVIPGVEGTFEGDAGFVYEDAGFFLRTKLAEDYE